MGNTKLDNMGVNKVWCTEHYRLIPPIVDPRFATQALIGQLLKDKRFQELCGRNDETGEKAKSNLVQEKLDDLLEQTRVCCFLGDTQVQVAMVGVKQGKRPYQNGKTSNMENATSHG
jgi:hypothetical protein